jgi:coproporphyrinogen III oxidase
MTIDEFVESMKEKAIRGLLELSATKKLPKQTCTFSKGQAEIITIRGGAIEKAAIQHMTLQDFTPPGMTGKFNAVVYQMEVFPENPYAPMGHFNTDWVTTKPGRYFMNLDLFPAVRVEEDIKVMKAAMDNVAVQFGRDRDKMRDGLDEQYTMDHFTAPLTTKVGCRFRDLRDEDLDLYFTAYETFLNVYIDIISKRKDTACTESDLHLKLERNGKWLQYLVLKDRAIRGGQDQGIPPEVTIGMGFPPSASF